MSQKKLAKKWVKKKGAKMNNRGLASDSRWFMLLTHVHMYIEVELVASTSPLIFWVSRFNETSFQFDE